MDMAWLRKISEKLYGTSTSEVTERHVLDADVIALARCVEVLPPTDPDTYVVNAALTEEYEVARYESADIGHQVALVLHVAVLIVGRTRDAESCLSVHRHGQAGAVEAVRTGCGPQIRLADVLPGEIHDMRTGRTLLVGRRGFGLGFRLRGRRGFGLSRSRCRSGRCCRSFWRWCLSWGTRSRGALRLRWCR